MQFSNSFSVPLPPEEAWETLMDIPRIAPCLPGAELTDIVDENTYKGKVSVRLGPVLLAFAGTARFEERDEARRTARVRAQGTDSKGRGGANALVNFRLEPEGSGSKVNIDTDLNLSGSVAQYGRGAGMIQTVAAQLIGEFSKTLAEQIAQSAPAAAARLATETAHGGAPAGGRAGAAEEGAKPPPAAAKPISGFTLMLRVIWATILRLFRRKP